MNSNGNGEIVQAAAPGWVVRMREAAQNVLRAEDVEAIVRNQVELAKKGDKNAIKFVFEQVLGGGQVKAATLIQNNYHGAEPAPPHPHPQPEPGPRAIAARETVVWECDSCHTRVTDPKPPQMCRKCEKTRFHRVMPTAA